MSRKHTAVLIIPRFVVLLSLAGGCSSGTQDATVAGDGSGAADAAAERTMSPQELAARIEAGDAPLVLDVRTPQEFTDGHIPGAVNIPHDELADRIGELSIEQSGEVVVHCQRGGRASEAEEILRDAGFTKVLDMEGHFEEWQQRGLPQE